MNVYTYVGSYDEPYNVIKGGSNNSKCGKLKKTLNVRIYNQSCLKQNLITLITKSLNYWKPNFSFKHERV